MAGSISADTILHRSRGLVCLKATFTTDASAGTVPATVIGEAFGRIVGLSYDPGSAGTAVDTGADITITDADTGATLISLANAGTSALFKRPTQVITSNAGVAVSAATTAVDVNRDIYVAGKVKVAVAQGGNSKVGVIRLFVEEG